MITKGVFKFGKNVVLNEYTIKELNCMLLKYCSEIKYEAKTNNSKTLEFESCEELLLYDNFKKDRIVELEMTGYCGSKRVFTLDFHGNRHASPYIECSYNFTDADTETVFTNRLNDFFSQRVECYNHHLFCSIIAIVTIMAGSIYLAFKNNFAKNEIWSLALLAVMAYYLIENRIFKYLFPPIVFCWGNEIKAHTLRTNLRNNIFWTIIISSAIGIILELIF